jgi:hypothetical protein
MQYHTYSTYLDKQMYAIMPAYIHIYLPVSNILSEQCKR